ncbi:MAG: hypothetical protein J1G06_10180 [Oscillospiraceae bacterium]|nr:hypothetical protein [Oscillospiraceae bacterium]
MNIFAIAGLSIGVISLLAIALYVFQIIANWKIFTKAGEPGWKSIIPVYSSYVLFKLVWKTSIFWIVIAITIVTSILKGFTDANTALMLIVSILQIVVCIIGIIQMYRLSKAFGHGVGFALGLIFLNPIFVLILAFGSSQYVGNKS